MKIVILGYGKMGRAIEQIAQERGHNVVLRIGKKNQQALTKTNLQQADVAIDFSLPDSAFGHLVACFEANIPVVSGTTGWLDRFEEAQELCKTQKGGFFYASNFSIGMNIMMNLNVQLAKLMSKQKNYAISMEETHHIHKLDAPSGTAITLAEDMLALLPHKEQWVNTKSDYSTDLPIISYREGEVPGTHIVTYTSAIDTIKLSHEAHSRKGFALGAVLAAEFMVGKVGYFTMKNLLES